MDEEYKSLKVVGKYLNQAVYFNTATFKTYIEREGQYLAEPDVDERKGLIDAGLVKIINNIIRELQEQSTE